uniref:Uncharacterized protein n=1 Tax=Rhizophora mucronata TaxID=61149 RepID=A0A2P2NLK8_RHIMU
MSRMPCFVWVLRIFYNRNSQRLSQSFCTHHVQNPTTFKRSTLELTKTTFLRIGGQCVIS